MKAKTQTFVFSLLFFAISISFTNSCKKKDNTALPAVTTAAVSNISLSGAQCGGNVTSDGGSAVSERGICWSTSPTPTTADSKTTDGSGTGSFTSSLSGLSVGNTYYVRAYATNAHGTAYGEARMFQCVDLTIPMVSISAATFTMGSPNTELGRVGDETQFQVTLSPFRMSKYEITNAQYAAFLNAKGIGSDGIDPSGAYPTQILIHPSFAGQDFGLHYEGSQWVPVAGCENKPVIFVTWYGADEFATYAGGHLPTEAQWEYACRANTTTVFSTGDCLSNTDANYYWTDPYNTCTNTITTALNTTQAVGSYAPNAFGLYDMHGNVWEWCSDWYGLYPTTPQTDPTGASNTGYKVIRGGGWVNSAVDCRSAIRRNVFCQGADKSMGFRIVMNP